MAQPLFIYVDLLNQPRIADLLQLSPHLRNRPIVQKAVSEAGLILVKYLRRRWFALAASGGGGQWPPLSAERLRKKKTPWIMRETDTLLNSLSSRRFASGVRVTFRNGGHPDSKLTIRRLAEVHHTGEGKMPERRLIVDPPQQVIDRMVKVVIAAIEKEARRTERTKPVPSAPTPPRLRPLPPNARPVPRRRR